MERYFIGLDKWITEFDIDEASLRVLMTFYVLIFGFALLLGLANYIIRGIATLNFAKRTHVNNGWMGFVPFAGQWIIGRLSDVGRPRKKSGARLLTVYILYNASGLIYTGILLSFVFRMLLDEPYIEPHTAYIYGWLAAALILLLAIIALSVVYTVFYLMALYRITDNFAGGASGGFFAGIILGWLFLPLVMNILLLILSLKEPKFKDISAPPRITDAYPPNQHSDTAAQ